MLLCTRLNVDHHDQQYSDGDELHVQLLRHVRVHSVGDDAALDGVCRSGRAALPHLLEVLASSEQRNVLSSQTDQRECGLANVGSNPAAINATAASSESSVECGATRALICFLLHVKYR